MPKAKSVEKDYAKIGKDIAGFVAHFDRPNINARMMLLDSMFWEGVAKAMAGETPEIPEEQVPTLTSINPNQAIIGEEELVMTCTGANFTASSVIVFNGGEEPTNFYSATEISTIVKPETATTAGAFPVLVRTGSSETESMDFTFVSAEVEDEDVPAAWDTPKKGKKK